VGVAAVEVAIAVAFMFVSPSPGGISIFRTNPPTPCFRHLAQSGKSF
jgi:hypothetical protein